MKYCKYCGAQLDDDAVVCVKCGRALGEQPQGQTIIVQAPAAEPDRKQNGCGIAGFVFGLIGMIISWVTSVLLWWLAIPFAALGFLLSLIGIIVGKAKKQNVGLGIAGLILSILSVIIVAVVVLFLGALFAALQN